MTSRRRIDLHTHSTASDGTLSPASLMQAAAAAGLHVVALTDHDTTAGWTEAVGDVDLVRGAEISCTADGISLHLLAYLFDPTHAALSDALRDLRDSRVGRAERMVQRLGDDDHPVSWEQVRGIAGGTVGRPHIARALVEAGLVGGIDEAFTPAWIGTGGRYWVGKLELDVHEAIALVKAAGGVSVFAHPAASSRGRVVSEAAIAAMAASGLDGIEVDHPDHSPEARQRMRELAKALQLIPTGSSDFHGSNKAVRLGQHLTAPEALDALVDRASGIPVLTRA